MTAGHGPDGDSDGFAAEVERFYGTNPTAEGSAPTGPSVGFAGATWESYWYSRYYLISLGMQSGAGLHALHGPVFGSNMSMMMGKLGTFGNLTGGMPPANAFPVYAPFSSATPQFGQALDMANMSSDFATLRWDLTGADRDLNLAATAQNGLKQLYWVEYFLAKNHKISDGSPTDAAPDTGPLSDPAGATIALGKPKLNANDFTTEGFRGLVLNGAAIAALRLLRENLARNLTTGNLEAVDLMNPDDVANHYLPDKISYDTMATMPMMPPKPLNWSVADGDATLWGQASALWFASRYHWWASQDAQNDVFGGNGMTAQPFPGPMAETGMAGPEDLSMGLANLIFKTLTMHLWDSDRGTFVDSASYASGSLTPTTTATTANLGVTLVALAQWQEAVPSMANMIDPFITGQADFILDSLQQADGGVANSYDLSAGTAAAADRTLLAQTSAIRGLLAAYDATGQAKYKAAAVEIFDYMEKELWLESRGLYASDTGAAPYTYTPLSVGYTVAALRELDLAGQSLAHYRYTQVWDNLVNSGGFQQSEMMFTGETGMTMDDDSDGIPKSPMQTANGASYGTAPVPAGEISLSGAGDWSITDYTFYTDQVMFAANEFNLAGLPYQSVSVDQNFTEALEGFVAGYAGRHPASLAIGPLKDSEGNPVSGATVTFDYNGHAYTDTTGADGKATLALDFYAGGQTYQVTATKTGFGDLTFEVDDSGVATTSLPAMVEGTSGGSNDDSDDEETPGLLAGFVILTIAISALVHRYRRGDEDL